MTGAALFFGVMFVIVWFISLMPRAIQESVIIMTSLIGIVASILGIVMGLGVDLGVDALNRIGAFKLIVTGIVAVVVMSLFYQAWAGDSYIADEEEEQ